MLLKEIVPDLHDCIAVVDVPIDDGGLSEPDNLDDLLVVDRYLEGFGAILDVKHAENILIVCLTPFIHNILGAQDQDLVFAVVEVDVDDSLLCDLYVLFVNCIYHEKAVVDFDLQDLLALNKTILVLILDHKDQLVVSVHVDRAASFQARCHQLQLFAVVWVVSHIIQLSSIRVQALTMLDEAT
jgi:hypothetical protein